MLSHFDPGYLGVKKDFPTVRSVIAIKKRRRKRKLTGKERRYNKRISKRRVIVEHTISRVKKFNVMNNGYRNRLKYYDDASDIISGLMNFRIMRSKGMMLWKERIWSSKKSFDL
jgi:hypothetical protein